MRTRRVTLKTTLGQTTIVVPVRGLGFWRGLAVSWRGVLDRRANTRVADETATHSVWMWQRRYQLTETEALRRGYQLVRDLDLEIAVAQDAQREQPGEAVTVPTVEELAQLSGADRQRWAERSRSAKRAGADRAAALGRVDQARRREVALSQDRSGVVHELELARAEWARVFEELATRYTRARYGGRRYQVTELPAAPVYRHTIDTTPAIPGLVTEPTTPIDTNRSQ